MKESNKCNYKYNKTEKEFFCLLFEYGCKLIYPFSKRKIFSLQGLKVLSSFVVKKWFFRHRIKCTVRFKAIFVPMKSYLVDIYLWLINSEWIESVGAIKTKYIACTKVKIVEFSSSKLRKPFPRHVLEIRWPKAITKMEVKSHENDRLRSRGAYSTSAYEWRHKSAATLSNQRPALCDNNLFCILAFIYHYFIAPYLSWSLF